MAPSILREDAPSEQPTGKTQLDASTASALERQALTYDQVREMSRHKELTERSGIPVYFADPHRPWQRGSNENANGLIREYLFAQGNRPVGA